MLSKLNLLAGLFWIAALSPAFAQPKLIDSLEKIVKNKSTDDTTRAKCLYKLSNLYLYNEPAKAQAVGNESLALSEKIHFLKGIAGSNNNLGNYYTQIGDYDKALEYHKASLAIRLQMKTNLGIGQSYLNISNVYYGQGNFAEASKYLFDALKYAELAKDDFTIGMIYANMANIYHALNKFDEALKYDFMLIKIREKTKDMEGLCIVYNNIGTVYRDIKKYDAALEYLKKANDVAVAINNINLMAYAQSNMGDVYRRQGKLGPALVAQEKALAVQKQLGDRLGISGVAEDIAGIYYDKGDFKKAEEYYNMERTIGEQLKAKKILMGAYDGLTKVYEAKKDFPQALKYFKQYTIYKDSILNETNSKQLTELQTKYQTEKKEKKITELNQENTIQKLSIGSRNKTIGIIIALFALSGIIAAWIFNRTRFKQKTLMQQQMLKQQELLTTAVIDAEEKERVRIASDLHDGVGQLFSAVRMNLDGLIGRVKIERDEDRFLAEKTAALVEESCKEIRSISHQMMPNMLLRSGIASDVKSFIEKIDSETLKVNVEAIGFKNKLESNVETVLYRVIQETVNNVIKHAKASKLEILLNRDADGITAVVADDGVGFDTSLISDFDGIGLKNIATRIAYLKGTVTYTSAPGEGTRVTVTVPVD